MRRRLIETAFVLVLLLTALPAAAQMDDEPTVETIAFGAEVRDSITETAIFDWWRVQAREGDRIVVEMFAVDTLEPLLGLLDGDMELVTRSADGVVGGSVTLEYTAERDGEYTIVATRTGNENGTSTGEYVLRVSQPAASAERVSPYQQVTFRCGEMLVANALSMELVDDQRSADLYRISVYGFDDFQPIIRIVLDEVNVEDCAGDSVGMDGDIYRLPGADPVTVTGDRLDQAAQLTIQGADEAGVVSLTVGSEDGAPGRFMVVIEGLTIDPNDDRDFVLLSQGPRAAGQALRLYMVADSGSRLDPAIFLEDDDETPAGLLLCDDIGRRSCDSIPDIEGLSIYISNREGEVTAGRFDAGILLPPREPILQEVQFGSFGGNTTGGYSLILFGELAVP